MNLTNRGRESFSLSVAVSTRSAVPVWGSSTGHTPSLHFTSSDSSSMGKGGLGRGKGYGTEDAHDAPSKYIKKVDHYKLLLKWSLRSYANVDGQVLFTNGMTPSKYYTESNLREILDSENSELIRRLGLGVSLSSGNVLSGLEALSLIGLPSDVESKDDVETQERQLKRTGLLNAIKWLRSDGADLEGIVQYLNSATPMNRSEGETKERFQSLMRVMDTVDDSAMKAFAQSADTAARLYMIFMSLLELKAVTGKLKVWAKKVPEIDKQLPAVKKWVAEPNEKNLLRAVAASYKARDEKPERKGLADSSSEESGNESDDNFDADSSDAEKRKKNAKKN